MLRQCSVQLDVNTSNYYEGYKYLIIHVVCFYLSKHVNCDLGCDNLRNRYDVLEECAVSKG